MSYEIYPYTAAEKSLVEGCDLLSDLLLPIDQRAIEDPEDLFEQIRHHFGEALSALEQHAIEIEQVGTESTDEGDCPVFREKVIDPQLKEAFDTLKGHLNGLEAIQNVPDLLTGDTILLVIEGYREHFAPQLAKEKAAILAEPFPDPEWA
ncbi:hypothetical protein RBE51_21090 [Pseudomonas taiwanensis]|uniref:hypothetical protein n=1 Tax=Pseudomonas taiwanensis TaxID=470150 RepID=UPI0028DDEB90|nr:hypothetical protein [Pseudomonas taiwanensis]MDT8925293.1 hypothetical protein [Pseudomonas taiwanensis]